MRFETYYKFTAISFVDVRIDSSYKSTKLVKFDFYKGTKVILGVGGKCYYNNRGHWDDSRKMRLTLQSLLD